MDVTRMIQTAVMRADIILLYIAKTISFVGALALLVIIRVAVNNRHRSDDN